MLSKAAPSTNAGTLRRYARFLASLTAAAIGFRLLNTKPKSYSSSNHGSDANNDAHHLEAPQQSSTGRPRSRSTAERALKNVAPFTIKPPRRRVERLLSEAGLYTIPSDFLAGRTIDLTLFAFVRALDVLGSSWNQNTVKSKTKSKQAWWHMDWATTFFTLSCAAIMHAWFYAPDRLPPTYNAWISKAAQLDPRVLESLRRCRRAEFVYGQETGQADLLGQVCEEEGLPYDWGNPAKTIPVREEIVDCSIALSGRPWRMGIDGRGHRPSRLYQLMAKFAQGTAGSERHALMRFLQGWYFAALMYFPLQLVGLGVRLYALPAPNRTIGRYFTELMVAVRSAARSASFLGAFIALVYYGVSLGRHRIGPKALHMVLRYRDMQSDRNSGKGFRIPGLDLLFGSEIAAGKVASDAFAAEYSMMQATGEGSVVDLAQFSAEKRKREIAQMLDGGLAVNLGCWLCGLSLLAEEPRRRVEIMLFVAPRAVGAWVPRVYNRRVSTSLHMSLNLIWAFETYY